MTNEEGYLIVANRYGFIKLAMRFGVLPLIATYVVSSFYFFYVFGGYEMPIVLLPLVYFFVGFIVVFKVIFMLQDYEVHLMELEEETDETDEDFMGFIKIKLEE